jgi:hypothetical protein
MVQACSIDQADAEIFDISEGEIQMFFHETQCNDPWYGVETYNGMFGQDKKLSQMISFLEQNQVEVLAASYSFDQDAAIACAACDCMTGGIFFIKVKNNQETLDYLFELGFLM